MFGTLESRERASRKAQAGLPSKPVLISAMKKGQAAACPFRCAGAFVFLLGLIRQRGAVPAVAWSHQFLRQAVGQLVEQFGVQLEFLAPGVLVDRGDLVELFLG